MVKKSHLKNWMVQLYLIEFVLQVLEVHLDNYFMSCRNFCEKRAGLCHM